jgi:hypothetical protein
MHGWHSGLWKKIVYGKKKKFYLSLRFNGNNFYLILNKLYVQIHTNDYI